MSSKLTPSHRFSVGDLRICIFDCHQPDAPVIYLHDLNGYGRQALPILKADHAPAFTLITVTVPEEQWSHILAPWTTPENYPPFVACTGGADDYLKILTGTIIPQCEAKIKQPGWRGIAGYSLAGLFALYAFCKTDHLFDRVSSASGSLWFPGFQTWFFEHVPAALPASIYFSCGTEEFASTNPFLSPVKPTTEAIEAWFEKQNVPTTFVLNPGNHYQDVNERTAAGIAWILEHPQS